MADKEFVSHPLIKENSVERRLYQELLVARVLEKGNSLVVAPTALGKTIVAARLAAHILEKSPESKILFMAPTKPLATQHQASMRKVLNLEEEKIGLLTGYVKPEERQKIWKESTVITATPQTIESDLLSGRLDLKEVGLMIVDEAHRAVGDYAYCYVSNKYVKQNPDHHLILALTASPGSEEEKISDVCRNLHIQNIEVKTHNDMDVKPYVHEIDIHWSRVELPPQFLEIKRLLEVYMREQMNFLRKLGYGRNMSPDYFKRTDLLQLQSLVRRDMVAHGKENPALYAGVSKAAALLKIAHAHTLLETQGVQALHDYFGRIESAGNKSGSPKAVRMILNNEDIRKAIHLTDELKTKNVLHPKMKRLLEILEEQFQENPEGKILVFNHYRDSIANLVDYVNDHSAKIRARKFVGQATKEKDKGLTQKQQIKIIDEFRAGKWNTLISSSVGEEGLDLPSVDLVVFFEPVPSEIRTIQRVGRTGRFAKGKVIVLMAKNTRDEGYYWAARAKERRMHKTLGDLKSDANLKLANQETLLKYVEPSKKVLIYADTREQASGLIKHLDAMDDVLVKIKQMDVGDFVLTDSIVVERKTVEDFIESMLDGRLFHQLVKMNSNYESPLLLVEGNPDELFSVRNIHRNAIIGALTSIALNYRVPVLFTKDTQETAEYLYVTAKREQLGKDKDVRLRLGRKGLTLGEQQRYIVESLPLIGPTMAKNLLGKFGSVKAILNADEKELQDMDLIGEKKAKQIRKVIESEYQEKD